MFRLEKYFLQRDPPPTPVKGRIFDTRFGLIHVQTGKKNFCRGTPPPPPPVKGKIFDTRFGLIHVQTGKKNFRRGTPPRNSKDLLWLRGGRYASCVHAGGLSCYFFFFEYQSVNVTKCSVTYTFSCDFYVNRLQHINGNNDTIEFH